MLTGNFILYLAVQFVMQFIPNIIVSVKVDKEFPYLKECRELPEKEEFHGILRNIGAMSFHKLGTVIVRNTDSLLMSSSWVCCQWASTPTTSSFCPASTT